MTNVLTEEEIRTQSHLEGGLCGTYVDNNHLQVKVCLFRRCQPYCHIYLPDSRKFEVHHKIYRFCHEIMQFLVLCDDSVGSSRQPPRTSFTSVKML